MHRFIVAAAVALVWIMAPLTASAHFGMVIPSDPMVMSGEDKTVHVHLRFWHPFEDHGMELVKPKVFAVRHDGRDEDLLGKLVEGKVNDHMVWDTDYKLSRPGLYVFHMEPEPYWEPAEDCFIIHITKSYVTGFGEEEGWDEPLGLKAEIVPLSKPYGLYAGNVFQGVVLRDGKPVPGAEVEVEYWCESGPGETESDVMITQTIKADPNGVITYAAPKAGWWGFAALGEADFTLPHDGEDKGVEIGAVIWVRFYDMK